MAPADPTGAGVEIERKFLVTHPPGDLDRYPSHRLEQGYLAVDPDGAVVRLRRRGVLLILTIKSGRGIQRAEEEVVLDGPRFARLWPLTEGRRVTKRRYRLPADGGLTIELDVYEGALAGLVTAEIEAPSLEAVMAVRLEPWMRLDVTADSRYGNSSLATDGIPPRAVSGAHGLLEGEAPGTGVVAVALGELDAAIDALRGGQRSAKAVHTSRKAFKRVRAIIRVAHDGLGDAVVERDNAALRDAGRALASARDAKVAVDSIDGLLARDPKGVDVAAAAPLRDLLLAEHETAQAAAEHDAGTIAGVLEQLAVVRADLSSWNLGPNAADHLAAGLLRVHHRGRKALRRAERAEGEERTEAMHTLRKRAKDLWHAAELLEAAAPKRLGKLAEQAHRLADLIGDDHDLAVLAERIAERAPRLPDGVPVDAIDAAIARRRRKLQRKALHLAAAIYGADLDAVGVRVQELPAREVA